MSFEVKVESAGLLQQFDDMQNRVLALDNQLPQVFLDWQRDDMNRTYPAIDERQYLSVMTRIYPRSRRVRSPGVGSGGKSSGRRKQARRIAGVKRPILRQTLVDQLFDRMKKMCMEAIEWR